MARAVRRIRIRPDWRQFGIGLAALGAWLGSFALLWMVWRYWVADPMVSVMMAGIGLVSLAPLLGALTRPTADARGH
ncbi:MAG: hypothetical protein J7483_06220 [Novosphingobium sp.]|nr:hypothetical protein [Novosphingobium sp.]